MVDVVILVPLKDFTIAKNRLRSAGIEDVDGRVRQLALGVITASQPRPVIVITEALDVADFAHQHGVESLVSDANDLNAAVQLAYQTLEYRFAFVVVAHGDLAHPKGLGTFSPETGVTIVTDHHGTGTNVMALPTGLDFHFAYGKNSKFRHQQEAQRLGVECRVIERTPWALDIDEPDDLEEA